MLLRFLCLAHRTLVEQSHSRALSVWDLSQQKALLFQQRGEPERAVAAAGGALEAAEVLLTMHRQATVIDLHRFTDAACLTLGLIRDLRQPELTRRLLCGCIAKLQPQVVSGAHQGTALACCQRLVEASTPSERIDAHEPVANQAEAGNRLLH
ncbi:MAG TPA: hypothetical protein DCP75_04380 [Haliea salexigens]|uniref:Uncharacterized protein n=1 Tax=Haliea salexigens TaxID=287487 RepID=A0A3C1KK23_9GAMM|nr:hypothetical protein [Haliea salexigens]